MVDFAEVGAIDFHTHAEDPCNGCRANGYKSAWRLIFANPADAEGMSPNVQDTAACYRERNIAAVIFPLDAECETGFRRYSN